METRALLFSFSLLVACGTTLDVRVPTQLFAATNPASVVRYVLYVFADAPCAQLLSGELLPEDATLVHTRVSQDFDGSQPLIRDIPKGSRTFYVELFDEPAPLGAVVGRGCVDGVTILGGKTVDVSVAIVEPLAR